MRPRPDPDMQALADTLRAAAAILLGAAPADGPPRDLLLRLGYHDDAPGDAPGDGDARQGTDAPRDPPGDAPRQAPHRAALLRAAAGFRRIFTLAAEDAPGLVALGAEVDPACLGLAGAPLGSVSGTGLTFRQAFERCVGEGVEYLSQFATPGDPIEQLTDDEALADGSPAVRALWRALLPFRRDPEAARTGWTVAADLADGSPLRLPADICFRRPPEVRNIDLPWPLSNGCGAGPDHLSATLHGLLELIERDAVALWWRGGRRGRMVPPGTGASALAQLRGGSQGRHTWLLDITSDVGVPVVVAASCTGDGFGLCCGHAAGTTLDRAADAAVREMAQMELASRLSAMKRSVRGEAALNDVDRQHLRRFTAVDVAATPALQPLAPPSPPSNLPPPDLSPRDLSPRDLPPRDLPAHDKLATLAEVRRRLAAVGMMPCALNLTLGCVRHPGDTCGLPRAGAVHDAPSGRPAVGVCGVGGCRSHRCCSIVKNGGHWHQ